MHFTKLLKLAWNIFAILKLKFYNNNIKIIKEGLGGIRWMQYLIEKASKESDVVHVFVVSEDRSVFSAKVRYNLVE